mmetsp:Transcript_33368/g.76158  ORF Transcript_33368/g.76158 Transcript_33368/m.76158 type:complete len:206 (-) Transcript_33368:399-1016(-)
MGLLKRIDHAADSYASCILLGENQLFRYLRCGRELHRPLHLDCSCLRERRRFGSGEGAAASTLGSYRPLRACPKDMARAARTCEHNCPEHWLLDLVYGDLGCFRLGRCNDSVPGQSGLHQRQKQQLRDQTRGQCHVRDIYEGRVDNVRAHYERMLAQLREHSYHRGESTLCSVLRIVRIGCGFRSDSHYHSTLLEGHITGRLPRC